jgi:hypothetical protein
MAPDAGRKISAASCSERRFDWDPRSLPLTALIMTEPLAALVNVKGRWSPIALYCHRTLLIDQEFEFRRVA